MDGLKSWTIGTRDEAVIGQIKTDLDEAGITAAEARKVSSTLSIVVSFVRA